MGNGWVVADMQVRRSTLRDVVECNELPCVVLGDIDELSAPEKLVAYVPAPVIPDTAH
jgi:hypothetical protein